MSTPNSNKGEVSQAEANQVFREFLETYPLLRKVAISLGVRRGSGGLGQARIVAGGPPIRMDCGSCGCVQTFQVDDDRSVFEAASPDSLLIKLSYLCAGCEKSPERILFFLERSEGAGNYWTRKIGQHPPWSAPVEVELKRALKKHHELFRKGKACEGHGYGVGAFAYYRRVIEDMMDTLFDDIASNLNGEEKTSFEKAVAEARGSKRASEKLNIVKDELPSFLRPGGRNPFAIMYGALSEGLHKQSDEECMGRAARLREALQVVVVLLADYRDNSARLARALGDLQAGES